MKRELVQYLVCPKSGEPLRFCDNGESGAQTGEIENALLTSASGKEYSVTHGVPRLVDRSDFVEGQKDTIDSFSEKWKIARDYRSTTTEHYEQWYLDRYGFHTLENLGEFLKGKNRILDAGTGHGRDVGMYARVAQDALVFGIDLSEGICNAYEDFGDLKGVHLIQADLQRLPFEKAFFDFIACDQVIHHTPNTYESLKALLQHLEPDGHIAFYVYKVKAPAREFCDDHIREHSVKMSVEECMEMSEAITAFGKSLSELNVTIDVPQDIPLLGIQAGKHDLQRFIYWHMFKCYWNETMSWEANVITNFDWYHPLHAHRHTPEEVQGWCEEQGLSIEHFDIQESGISVLAKKAGS